MKKSNLCGLEALTAVMNDNCQCHYVNCHKTFNEDNGCGVDDAYCSEECILDEMDFENQSAEDHEFGYQEYLNEEWFN